MKNCGKLNSIDLKTVFLAVLKCFCVVFSLRLTNFKVKLHSRAIEYALKNILF